MDNGITFLPNDRYLLENGKFRLYYTAEGEEHTTSSWWWRTTSATPSSWNLTSTTGM